MSKYLKSKIKKYCFLYLKYKYYILYFVFTIIYFTNLKIFIGGDDSRLYLMYPDFYLRMIDQKILFGYFSEFNPQIFYFPFVLLGSVIRIFFSPEYTYKILLSINFIIALITTHVLIKNILIKIKLSNYDQISFLSSLVYTIAPLTYYTLYLQPLTTIYALSLFPLISLILFFIFIKRSYKFIFIGNILLIPYSIVFYAIPIIIAFVIPLSILFVFFFFYTNKKLLFLNNLFLFTLTFIILNSYWLPIYILSLFNGSSISTGASALDVAISTVRYVSKLSDPLDIIRLLPSFDLYSNQKSINFIFSFAFVNYIFIIIIILGFFKTLLTKKFHTNLVVVVFFFLLFFTYYLQTVNIHPLGTELFVFLTKYVPGWGMFRNFFNKFTLPFVLIFSISLSYSLGYLHKYINKRLYKLLVYFLIILTVVRGLPFLFSQIYYDVPFEKGSTYYYNNEYEFSEGYLDFIEYLEVNNTGRVLSLPLTYASWSYMVDDNLTSSTKSIYLGLSPLNALSNIDDLNGKFALDLLDDESKGLSKTFKEALTNSDRVLFDKIINYLNIEHIILFESSLKETNNLINEKFIWDGNSSQSYENIKKILVGNERYEQVEDFDNGNIKIYKNKNYKGEIYLANYLVSLKGIDNIWDKSIIDFISNDSILVNRSNLNNIDPDYEIVQLKKLDQNNLISKSEEFDMVLPQANNNPNSFKYIFVKFYEYLNEVIHLDKSKKIDIMLWHTIKRGVEFKKYAQQPNLLRVYNDEITKFINVVFYTNYNFNNYPLLKEKYLKLTYYIEKLESIGVRTNDQNRFLLDDLSIRYKEYPCDYDYCYVLPNDYYDYSILLPNSNKIKITDLINSEKINIGEHIIYFDDGILGVNNITTPLHFELLNNDKIFNNLILNLESTNKKNHSFSNISNLKPGIPLIINIRHDETFDLENFISVYELKRKNKNNNVLELSKTIYNFEYYDGFYNITLSPSEDIIQYYVINNGFINNINAFQKNINNLDIHIGKINKEINESKCSIEYVKKNSYLYEYTVTSKDYNCANYYLVYSKYYSKYHHINNNSNKSLSPTIKYANGYENSWSFKYAHTGEINFTPYIYSKNYYIISLVSLFLILVYLFIKKT